MRYGYHLVTDCRKANQGKKSLKDVEATTIHHLNTYTSITATKAKPFSNDTQADILLSGITTIDNPAARNLYLDVTPTNPMGVTNQEFINRDDPRNDVLTSASSRRNSKTTSTTPSARQRGLTGSHFSPFALETTGGQRGSTATV